MFHTKLHKNQIINEDFEILGGVGERIPIFNFFLHFLVKDMQTKHPFFQKGDF